ncbi:glycosyltransferase [Aquimarina agarilytica]|uniref:glycosyltransferase n=1 Tax=Aquimarina agarilytica TaxID=1087449 RepID=UPI000287EDBE|nr:glycosyltransferase [Aquimarina agarilytica]
MSEKSSKLLIIGHVWPQPNATAAGEHMLHLIHFFKDLKYQIFFVSAAQQPSDFNVFENLVIQTASVAINDDNFDTLLLDYAPDVVLFDRFMVEEQFSWRVKKECPNAIRILDTEDLHFLRKQRQKALNTITTTTTTTTIVDSLSDQAKRELASMYRCDLNLMISLKEIDILTTTYNFPKHLLHYIPLLSDKVENDLFIPFNERKDLVFVGNFLHEPNWHAVQILKKEIWPVLSKKIPNVKLHIYGAYATEKNYQLHNEKQGFLVHGYVKDLEAVLEKSSLLLAPLYFGAGQKGKLLKAMQCGTPTVTTSLGAEAMQFDKLWPGAIADDINDFIERVITLYTDAYQWNKAQQNIAELVNSHYLYNTHFNFFKEKLVELIENITIHRTKNITGQILWHQSMRSTEFMSRWIIEKNK